MVQDKKTMIPNYINLKFDVEIYKAQDSKTERKIYIKQGEIKEIMYVNNNIKTYQTSKHIKHQALRTKSNKDGL